MDLAQGALVLPGLLDGGGALRPDAGHAAQPGGLLAEHAEGVGAERVDDLVGVDLADAGHEAAAEVLADAVDGGGQFGGERLDLELVAVLAVARPLRRAGAASRRTARPGSGPTMVTFSSVSSRRNSAMV